MQEIELELQNPPEVDIGNIIEVKKYLKGDKGDMWDKGEDGKTPTKEELVWIIKPLIKNPTKKELVNIIEEVLPSVVNQDEVIKEIVKQIPTPKDGKDGKDGKDLKFSDLTPYQMQILTWPPWNAGEWVPRGGTTGQILSKKTNSNFNTEWVDNTWGGADQVFNEVPAGLINSSNTIYTTASNFTTGTTRIYLNGLRQTLTSDYTESALNEITFIVAPTTGDTLILDYQL